MKRLAFTGLVILIMTLPTFGDVTACKHWNYNLGVWDHSLTTSYMWDEFVGTGGVITHMFGGNGDYPAGNSAFQGCVEFTPPTVIFHHDYDSVVWNNAEGTIECWIAPHWNGENQGSSHPNGSLQDVIIGDGSTNGEWQPIGQGFNLFFHDNGDVLTPGYQMFVVFVDGDGMNTWENYEVGNTMDWVADEWHHICISWDASEVMAGIDGTIFMKKTRNGGFNMVPSGYLFGMYSAAGPINCWDGWADDLTIWNEARYTGLGDVGDSYQIPTTPVISGPNSPQDVWDLGFGMDNDLNQDCYINFRDFAILANNNWDFVDLALFVKDWLRSNHPDDPDGEKPWIPRFYPDGSPINIIISDMSNCRPAEAVSTVKEQYHWQLIDYKGDGLKGVMLSAASHVEAPDVTLPLNVSGWYAIYIGFWNAHHVYDGSFRIKLKLSDDESFQAISDPEPGIEWTKVTDLKETFFKCADLTGRDLVIGQHSKGLPPFKASIAYVKLVPLTEQDIIYTENDRADTSKRMLYALNDGNGLFYRGQTTREDLLEAVEQYRYSDVKALMFAVACGDLVNYPSNVGTRWYCDTGEELNPPGWKVVRDSVQTLLDQDIVPVQVLSEYMHEMGRECHVMFRLAITGDIPATHHFQSIAHRRPDLRMVSKDGTPMEKMSYAYPEVREHVLSMIREVAEGYDIDGVNLCFIRGPQFVGYEDIVVNDFINIYGIDPRELDENDIRAQEHRASYVNEFVRSARNLIDEINLSKGSDIKLSAMVNNGEASQAMNLFFGLDVWTWINEELLDSIFMSGSPDSQLAIAMASHNCTFIVQTNGTPTQVANAALDGFGSGASGFWAWDLNAVQEYPDYWQVYNRIGHQDEMNNFTTSVPAMKTIRLNTIAGLDVTHTTNVGSNERGYWPPEMLPLYSGG